MRFSWLVYLYHTWLHGSVTNLSYMWNFGIFAMMCLIIQIITGILLAMHYTPEINLAFYSVEHIMRDVNYGWLLRYVHANGGSMFFIVVYIHTFRGLYYGSYLYPRQPLWMVGVIILLLMIITAFLGYVLPWGQMSFWGATVITNLVSAVPYIGGDLVIWLWGGHSINNATLNRFFSLHFFLPFVILGLVGIHVLLLHEFGSNNPCGLTLKVDDKPFYPYYIIKDINGVVWFMIFFSIFVFFYPNLLGHADNYILANPMVTPPHIVPEWYFLPFYAILRSVPDKLGGVIGMVFAIIILLLLPLLWWPEIRSMEFRPVSKLLFWFIVIICLILGWIGGKPVEYPFVIIGQVSGILYFTYFLAQHPLLFSESGTWFFDYPCLSELPNENSVSDLELKRTYIY